ncbi:bifunctional diguanylate cyclase/phosphodiesterase [Poseidonocella sp. HB161398]|uniref:putative bifunctional diguanylate cyclase/phosphodiesterase n=1 Tax=Poseidonocella sp. HB161398 TaxID=2320855 RepID=UPI001F0E8C38|nr:GGDEF domain-containing protein [Poseidonocella sp. HB161398]
MSFRLRVLLIFALLGMAAHLALAVASFAFTTDRMQDRFITQSLIQADFLAEALEHHFVDPTRHDLEHMAESAVRLDEIAAVDLRDAAGAAVLSKGRFPGPHRIPWFIAEDAEFAALADDPELGPVVLRAVEVDGVPMGMVLVAPDLHWLETELAGDAAILIALAAATMAGLIGFGWIAATALVRRLEELDSGAAQIADGDFGHRLALGGEDEIARTAATVNRMADALLREREALEAQARTDALSGLLNRTGLARAFRRMARGPIGVSALHIDLDRFKMINDTRGHVAGDAVLKSVARRLSEVAPPGALVARIGGDEFAMVVEEEELGCRSAALAEACIEAASRPIEHHGMKLAVGASVGIAHLPPGGFGADADRLLADADIALYQAKEAGRGRVALFDGAAREVLESQADLEFELALGLEYGEFVPFLQPQIDVQSGEVIGAEVLARWQSPSRGLLAPGAFLTTLRNPELEERITYAVRAAALDWMARTGPGRPPAISINLSAGELARVDCAGDLDWELAMRGLPARRVAIEVLEDVVLRENDTEVERTIAALRSAGHPLELDDFGTGNSGLGNLVRLSVEQLKIDRSFVSGIALDRSRQAIVEAMIGIGRALDIKVLAEGVETEAERQMLISMGCTRMQGFHFARPMDTAAFETWMAARSAAA